MSGVRPSFASLLHAANPECAGRVYRIPRELADEIWAYLDHREKDGYTMRTVDVWGLVDGREVIVEKDVRFSLFPVCERTDQAHSVACTLARRTTRASRAERRCWS